MMLGTFDTAQWQSTVIGILTVMIAVVPVLGALCWAVLKTWADTQEQWRLINKHDKALDGGLDARVSALIDQKIGNNADTIGTGNPLPSGGLIQGK